MKAPVAASASSATPRWIPSRRGIQGTSLASGEERQLRPVDPQGQDPPEERHRHDGAGEDEGERREEERPVAGGLRLDEPALVGGQAGVSAGSARVMGQASVAAPPPGSGKGPDLRRDLGHDAPRRTVAAWPAPSAPQTSWPPSAYGPGHASGRTRSSLGRPSGPPTTRTALGEVRAALDAARLVGALPRLAAAPRGDGHLVIDIPGWKAPEVSGAPLRQYLRRLGYDARGWGFGTNTGGVRQDIERLSQRGRGAGRGEGRSRPRWSGGASAG